MVAYRYQLVLFLVSRSDYDSSGQFTLMGPIYLQRAESIYTSTAARNHQKIDYRLALAWKALSWQTGAIFYLRNFP